MKPTRIDNVLTVDEISTIKEYMLTITDRTDARPDITSQHPVWDSNDWPKEIITRVLDENLPFNYQVDDIVFFDSKSRHTLHIDDQVTVNESYTVLFAIEANPKSETVFFNNFYTSSNGGIFTKKEWNPYTYTLEGVDGRIKVNDLRELLLQCQSSPTTVTDFIVDDQFIDMLEQLILKRTGLKGHTDADGLNSKEGYTKPGPRNSDYSVLLNYDPSKKFDEELHKKYLTHIDLEDLHGLEVSDIVEWKEGSILVFDSSQLHASSDSHNTKKFITIFLHKV